MTPKREQTLRQSIQMDPKRHRFHNKAALILTVVSFGLLMTLSFLFSSPVYRQQRLLDEDNEDDFSQFSCRYIFEKVPDSGYAQCRFAKTCNGGEGIWSSWVFCRYNTMSVRTLFLILSPFIALWMTILFRLLGSTAEDYFSPSLEMFSVKLGLPPRFAGVSLLALGNGAADVSATMSAISGDEENGYKLSLGALSGAAMLVGGVVSGLVIITAGGVPCRGALVRDVMALLITVVIVWTNLASGSIGPGAYSLFLSLYGFFVFTVLVADVYHRAIVMPRLRQAVADGDTPEDPTFSSEQQTSAISRFITSISNYDNISGFGPWAQRTNTSDQPIVDEHTAALSIDQPAPENDAVSVIEQNTPVNLLGRHGVLRGDGRALSAIPGSDPNDSVGAYTLVDEQIDQFCSTGGPGADISASNWSGAWYDGSNELRTHMNKVWEDIASNGDLSQAEKFILICELPFTIGRQVRISN
jgi:sodium/potassium/calcium exchanger 6